MQDLIRKQPGVVSTPGRLHRRPERARHVPQPPGPRRGHRDHLRPGADGLPRAAGVLLPDPRSDHQEPAGQRRRHQLPLGDLLRRRRAEARRAGHHRRCRRLGPVARQGRHGGRSRRRLLGGRAGASGLPGALPRAGTPAISHGPGGNCPSARKCRAHARWAHARWAHARSAGDAGDYFPCARSW